MRITAHTRQLDPERTWETLVWPVTGGLELMWEILAGRVRNEQGGLSDHLGKGRVIVGDGRRQVRSTDTHLAGAQTMWAEVRPDDPVVDAGTATFTATFAADVANFRWSELGFTTVQGVLICRVVADQELKAGVRVVTLTIDFTTDVVRDKRLSDEAALLALL